MINLFLRAKHWQIFILTFLLPFIAYMFMMVNMFSNIIEMQSDIVSNDGPPNPFFMLNQMKYFGLVMFSFAFFQYVWQWSVGSKLHTKLPSHVSMNLNLFKACILIPFIYTLVLSIGMGSFFEYLSDNMLLASSLNGQVPEEMSALFKWFPLFVILHLLSIICMFYNLFFISKALKSAETQDHVTGSDYVAEFFLTWFFPVGVWFLQPRINNIFNTHNNSVSKD